MLDDIWEMLGWSNSWDFGRGGDEETKSNVIMIMIETFPKMTKDVKLRSALNPK